MNPQEAVDFFYALLVENFHYGHQRGEVDRAYKQVCEKLNTPVTGSGERPSEISDNDFIQIKLKATMAACNAAEQVPGWQFPLEAALDAIRPYLRLPEPVAACEVSVDRVKTILFPYLHDQITTEAAQRLISELRPYLRSSEPVSVDLAAGAKAICDSIPFSWIDEEKIVPSELTLPLDEERSDARVLAGACAKAWGLK